MNVREPAPQAAVYELITGYHVSQAVYVAAILRLPDLIASGIRHYQDLAGASQTHPPSLRRLLRMLVSAGVLREDDNGLFTLTAIGEYLRSDVPDSMHAAALLWGGRPQLVWSRLLRCVQNGEPAFARVFGKEPFGHMATHHAEADIFDKGMAALTQHTARAVVAAYDFSSFNTVVDIGGGNGTMIATVLAAYPSLHGILFDLPQVVQRGARHLAELGFAERCEIVGGDFFEAVSSADAYIVSNVITDWPDEAATTILRNCQAAMNPNGKLLLIEAIYPKRIDQSSESRAAVSTDLNVMVCTGGRERSEEEFRELYKASGFILTRIVETAVRPCVIEGQRALIP